MLRDYGLTLVCFAWLCHIGCSQSNKNKCEVLMAEKSEINSKNVYGDPLIMCCLDPLTGFYRNGLCQTGADDYGTHIVCARLTDEFLEYSKMKGNDLITPRPDLNFPGLRAGDHWCLCISRWIEAQRDGVAPPIKLEATHEKALNYMTLEVLELYSIAKAN